MIASYSRFLQVLLFFSIRIHREAAIVKCPIRDFCKFCWFSRIVRGVSMVSFSACASSGVFAQKSGDVFRQQSGDILAINPSRVFPQPSQDRFRGDFVQQFLELRILFHGTVLLLVVSVLIPYLSATRDRNSTPGHLR